MKYAAVEEEQDEEEHELVLAAIPTSGPSGNAPRSSR